jgi:Protein of unknown function (DUF4079)
VSADPTASDPLLRAWAWVHPAWMVASLVLAALALRLGLRMRRARLGGAPRERGLLRRHLRLARPAALLVAPGFAGGLASAVWLRGWTPFQRLHAWLALLALALFLAAALLGRRLERGRDRRVGLHGLLGLLAVLAGAVAAVAGFVLLP